MRFRDLGILRVWRSAKGMRKNAKLAPLQTSLKQVAVFLHNADFLRLRVTKPPPNLPAERCCFALVIGCWKNCVGLWWYWLLEKLCWFVVILVVGKKYVIFVGRGRILRVWWRRFICLQLRIMMVCLPWREFYFILYTVEK